MLCNLHSEPSRSLSISALTRTLLYSSGSASNLVTSMVKSNLVEREPSQTDGRVTIIRPTEAGAVTFDAATTLVLDTVREEFAGEPAESELPAVAAFLSRVRSKDPNLRRPPYDLPFDL
ncbi:MarR family transcriptional regulator [Subtercola vilae]|uniref:MarR family transcriptional regulator n=2 Tax=Subtercola vilae TaxID=2056433 RepID=A0A4T2C4Q9_9MICO|nr:MarR family transcriptional regulator [Subtercola vilae]TIH38689.1 MarR family transcriptional regulator [Subtercola vilae]